MKNILHISDEVRSALEAGKPVVALESTIISHGMPYPQNVETALKVEEIIRQQGAVPATTAIIGGVLKCGLTTEEIEYLGKKGLECTKCSRRDFPMAIAKKLDGATTVAGTMIIAHLAGIKIFATGGIGGVHRGAEKNMDISADLEELSQTPVMVVCAGAKAILDLPLTREYLETKGVPVLGYGVDEMPAFFTRESGLKADYRVDDPKEAALAFKAQRDMGFNTGMLMTNPIPEEYAMDVALINKTIEDALREADEKGIKGKDITPFLLDRIQQMTEGKSLKSNIELVFNNAKVAGQIAKQLSELEK